MHNALYWSYFRGRCTPTATTSLSPWQLSSASEPKQDLALSGCTDKSSMIRTERGNNVHVKCSPATMCMSMISCRYLNITRTRVLARESVNNTFQLSWKRLHHRCQNVDMDMIRWSQAISRHCYQIAGATEYFDHIKMWTLMRKADVRNYKLSHSHSSDQCVPESKSKILS